MSFLGRLRQLWRGVDVSDTYAHLTIGKHDYEQIRDLVLGIVDSSRFSKRILFVAASGFFTGSYTIFSTNVVTPALAYVYWPNAVDGLHSLGINIATLLGTCIGMVLFGYLADRFGRKRLYGVELAIVIAATLGLTQASAGYDNASMNIYPWIIFWRALLGIGVGAEYPLSALIASEWASTQNRGRMLAAVFSTQPFAQLVAQLVGLGALRGISRRSKLSHSEWRHEIAAPVIDGVWRCVIGVGAAPALLAIIGRLTIPETPRYLLEIERDGSAALLSTTEVYSAPQPKEIALDSGPAADEIAPEENADIEEIVHDKFSNTETTEPGANKEFYGPARASTEQILRQNANARANTTGQQSGASAKDNSPKPKETFAEWRRRVWGQCMRFMASKYGPILLATSFCWFLLDICVYGLGLDNPQLISKIWLTQPPNDQNVGNNNSGPPDWDSNFSNHSAPVYPTLEKNILHAVYTTGPASILGSLLVLFLINRLPRVRFMVCIFVVLAFIFAIIGGSLFGVYESSNHDVTVVLYAISLFLLNLGPNTVTFMLPAELFQTKNRGTCYGIAAASGKLGAIIIQIINWRIKAGGAKEAPLGILLLVFAPLMLLGAFVAWVWIPEVQEPVAHTARRVREYSLFSNLSLEEIAENPTRGQAVGLRSKIRHVLHSGE